VKRTSLFNSTPDGIGQSVEGRYRAPLDGQPSTSTLPANHQRRYQNEQQSQQDTLCFVHPSPPMPIMPTCRRRFGLAGFQPVKQSIQSFAVCQQRYSLFNPSARKQDVQKRLQEQQQLSAHKAKGLVRIHERKGRDYQPPTNQLLCDPV
jgi:hypothetical protein